MNALNVYPVPDGDTGTNLLHTVRMAIVHARTATATDTTAAAVAAAAAHGALMGARGNSGVILSQVLRGLKDALVNREKCTGSDLVAAFTAARTHAFSAVTTPAPGTMLTALAAMEEAVRDSRSSSVEDVLREAKRAGLVAVAATREQNPTNRAAGVVDAGARGLWLLLDGALAVFDGHVASAAVESVVPHVPVRAAANVPSWEGAYDVQFLVEHPRRRIETVREEMLEFGADCVLVVGDESVMKVHVHTLYPDEILRIGLTAGRVADVVVEDLDAMSAEHERTTGIAVRPPRPFAVVTVVPGEGFAEIARSLGAVALLAGATMNPSTEELLGAIREANATRTILLPNDRNVVLAARQAAALVDGVIVIPTENIAQGMASLLQYDGDRDPVEVTGQMKDAVTTTHCLEMTRSVRAATVDGQTVNAGESMALLDGRVVAHGDDELLTLAEGASRLDGPELLTVYLGAEVSPDRAETVRTCLAGACPSATVEVVAGGQPHYPFVIQVE